MRLGRCMVIRIAQLVDQRSGKFLAARQQAGSLIDNDLNDSPS